MDRKDASQMEFQGAIGRAVRLGRVARDLNQTELAEKAGVTKNYISMIETGRREPSLAVLRALSSVLRVPYEFFFIFTPKNREAWADSKNQLRLSGLLDALLDVVEDKDVPSED